MGLFDRLKEKTVSVAKTAKVVAFLNQKGGVGKTTLAFNVAHALAYKGHKVLCLDLDPQANLSLLFGAATTEKHMFHLLINSVRELKSLHSPVLWNECLVKKTLDCGEIHLLPAGLDLSGLELTVASMTGPRQLILKTFLEKNRLIDAYDYIVIDGPPTLGLLVVNILCACHGVLIPFHPDQFSQHGLTHLNDVLENIEDMGITETPKILGYIPNLVENRRKLEGEDFLAIKNGLGQGHQRLKAAKMFDSIANKAVMGKALHQRKSIFEFKAQEFNELKTQFGVLAKAIETGLQ